MKLFKNVILPLALSSMLLFSACSSSNGISAQSTSVETISTSSVVSETSSATITTTLGEQSSDTSEQTNIIASEDTIKREFGAYNTIRDNFPKYVVSLDEFDMSRNGIKHRNIREFLLAEEWK